MSGNARRISPPFSPPDCPWVSMKGSTELPENSVHFGGKLNGEPVYIGRAYDDGCYLIGTALPKKGICLYLSKKSEVKSTQDYDILTFSCNNPLEFQPMALDDRLKFVSGGSKEELLYTARVVDKENTYVGWADKKTKNVYIPRDSADGPNKIDSNYDILIHTFLDRLCICPPCPPGLRPPPPEVEDD